MKVRAYAKVNLALDVVRKREDGYHDLDMIMQTVGVPDIEDRYTLDRLCDCNLQEYVSKIQLFASDDIREKAIEIMDYL